MRKLLYFLATLLVLGAIYLTRAASGTGVQFTADVNVRMTPAITNGNVRVGVHGYAPAGDGSTTKALMADGLYHPVSGSGGGDVVAANNGSDFPSKPTFRSNVGAETRRTVSITDFSGFDATGATSSQTAIDAAIASLSSVSGGEIIVPFGKWKGNWVIVKPNVTISGVSHTKVASGSASLASFLIANDTTKPVIQVGNDTGILRGVNIHDLSLDGQNGGTLGLVFLGGAYECSVRNVASAYFDKCISIPGPTNYPISCIYFDNVFGQGSTTTGSRAWYIANSAAYPTNYVTEIKLNNLHWDGPATGTDTYLMEVDSTEIKWDGFYGDVKGGHGVKLTHNISTPLPKITANNSNLDGGTNTAVVVEGYTNDRNFMGINGVNFQRNGSWKELDATVIAPLAQPIKTILDKNAAVRGTLLLLNQGAGDGTSLIQQRDLINNKFPDIFFQNGSINLRSENGGAIKFGNISGSTWGQVNGTDGATFLYGAGITADGRPLQVDSINQLKSFTPTNSLTFALSDMTTALTTGTNKNYWIPKLAGTIKYVRANVSTVSSSGLPTFDVLKNGTSIFSTTLTIDASERTSDTAATPAVISSSTFAADDYINFSITTAGTAAAGAQIEIGYTIP